MILRTIDIFFDIYMVMLFIRILGSWIPEMQTTRFMHFISFYTDPYLNVFRRFIPPLGMIDISPIVAIFCLNFLEVGTKTLASILFL